MEEANRYFLVMLLENMEQVFSNKEDYEKFLLDLNKANRSEENPRCVGFVRTVHKSPEENWVVKYALYQKITKKYPLSVIDEIVTEKYENEKELKQKYKNETGNRNGKVYIGYIYNGVVKTIPVFYKKDKSYVSYDELSKLMIENATTDAFLSNVWSDKKLNSPEYRKNIDFYLEELQKSFGKYVMSPYEGKEIVENAVKKFVEVWCKHDGKINQRRVRDLGSIIKNNLEKAIVKQEEKPKIRELKPTSLEENKEIKLFY